MVQSIFLTVHVITFYMIYLKADVIDTQFIWKSIILTTSTFIILGFLQYLHILNPSIPYPSSFIFNNEMFDSNDSYSIDAQLGINRMAATFTEPSIAGAFIASSFWAFFLRKDSDSKL